MPYCSNRRMRATGCRTPESNFSVISSAKIDKDCDMQENIQSVVLVQARLFPECHTKDTIATRAYGQIIVGMYLLPTRMGLHRCIPLPECHVIFEFFQECANFFLSLLESVHFLVITSVLEFLDGFSMQNYELLHFGTHIICWIGSHL